MGSSLRPTPQAKPRQGFSSFFFGKSRKKQFTFCENCGKVYLVEDGLAPGLLFGLFWGRVYAATPSP